jgi:fructose-1,6-bisphosphatase I
MTDTTTLRRYLTKSDLDPNLIFLLEDIACRRSITNLVRNGAYEGNLGSANANVQGETQTLNILWQI